jgi:hypothetical protein
MLRTGRQANGNRGGGLVFGRARLVAAAAAGKASDPAEEQLAALLEGVSNDELSQATQQALLLQLQRQQQQQQPGQEQPLQQQQQQRMSNAKTNGQMHKLIAKAPSHVPISACVNLTSGAGKAAGKKQQKQQADTAEAITGSSSGAKPRQAAAATAANAAAAAAAAWGQPQTHAAALPSYQLQQGQFPGAQQQLLLPQMLQPTQPLYNVALQQQQHLPLPAAPLAHSPESSSDWCSDSCAAPVSSSCSAAPSAAAALDLPAAFELPAVPSDLVSRLSLNANCDDLLALLEELEGAE